MARDARRHGPAVIVDALVVIIAFAILTFASGSSVLVIAVAALLGAFALRRERPESGRVEE